jgi:hypothetical protein
MVLFITYLAAILLTFVHVGILPTDFLGGIAMIYTNFSTLVTGFVSSYVAGLALLP